MYTITIEGVSEHGLARELLGNFIRQLQQRGGSIISAKFSYGSANPQTEAYTAGGDTPRLWGEAIKGAPFLINDHPHSDTANIEELLIDSGALDLSAERIMEPGVTSEEVDHLSPDKAIVFEPRRESRADVDNPAEGPTISKQAWDKAEKAILEREAAEAEKKEKEEVEKQQQEAEKQILANRKKSEEHEGESLSPSRKKAAQRGVQEDDDEDDEGSAAQREKKKADKDAAEKEEKEAAKREKANAARRKTPARGSGRGRW